MIGFRRCPKCKGFMTPYLITTGRTYYKCTSCGYDTANETYYCTNKTDYKERERGEPKGFVADEWYRDTFGENDGK